MGTASKRRILFVAECVSLAQVVRLRQLAACLPPSHYEVHFAAAEFDPLVFGGLCAIGHHIDSMSPARLQRRLALGLRLYDDRTLASYVRQDLALLERVQPELVIGDLRLSLSVSAAKLGVPYAALINAYWNPPEGAAGLPMPEHPAIALLGAERVAPHFHRGLPFMLAHFAAPLNRLRRRYGLPAIGDLLACMTHGDHVLYPDVPQLTPVPHPPAHHHFLGPVLWSPAVPLPDFWDELPRRRPIVYVTLGSSGQLRVVDTVLRALAPLPVQVLLSTAGRYVPTALPDNVLCAPYLPGDLAARKASLVICNGGSSTGYQALCEGTPVLGLPYNMDQYLAMQAIARAGAGRMQRSGTASVLGVRDAVEQLLQDDLVHERARQVGRALCSLRADERFVSFVERTRSLPLTARADAP